MGAVGRIIRTFAAVVLIVTLYSCGVYGQSTIVAGKIRVILVDYKTGRPLKGHVVQLGLVDSPRRKRRIRMEPLSSTSHSRRQESCGFYWKTRTGCAQQLIRLKLQKF